MDGAGGLTSEILVSIMWIACATGPGTVNTGSGTIVKAGEKEFLVTAEHVINGCKEEPRVRFKGQWHQMGLELVLTDAEKDIAVMKAGTELSQLTPQYGMEGVSLGSLGRAIGFPNVHTHLSLEERASIFEMGGRAERPFPVATAVVAHLPLKGQTYTYAGGYVNSGYSGGAVVFPGEKEGGKRRWSVAGIITERGHVTKQQGIVEPSGMVKFVPINVVMELIGEGINGEDAE